MKRHIFYILLAIIFCPAVLKAQQYPVYSQYIFNPLVINPAYAGNHVQFSATLMYRNQWVNLDGAPRTTSLTMHSTLGRPSVGVGFMLTNDKIGSYNNTSVYGQYSYSIKMPSNGKLSMGVQGGFNLVSADYSDLNLDNDNDASFINFSNKIRPNFGAGVSYQNEKFYAGFSIPFILNATISSDLESFVTELKEARYYYLHGGAYLPLNPAKTAVVHPSLLLRTQEGQPLSMDASLEVIFQEVFSVGASYRNIDALVTYLTLKISDNFHFGYSYDWTSSDLNQFSNGSHEFMLNYRFRIQKFHGNVECPSFYSH